MFKTYAEDMYTIMHENREWTAIVYTSFLNLVTSEIRKKYGESE